MTTEKKEEIFVFLDEVIRSGKTNLFGAISIVQEAFGLSKKEATGLVSKWIITSNNIKIS